MFHFTWFFQKKRINEIKEIVKVEIIGIQSPRFDLITDKIRKELFQKFFKAIMQMLNAILDIVHFPNLWKVGHIIMIPKSVKN